MNTPSIASRRKTIHIRMLFVQLRPVQWTKNLLLFAALIFTIPRIDMVMVLHEVEAFVIFSLVSGCIYIVNDCLDLPLDRNDPEKRHRPMAAGLITPRLALSWAGVLLVVCLPWAFALHLRFFLTVVAYLALNVAYSFVLKNIVILDIFTIATGFVLRAAAGGFAIGVELTPWFLCCAMMLSLFLAAGKRKYEFTVWRYQQRRAPRPVLSQYTEELLNQLNSITAALVIMTYSLFTFSSGHTRFLMLTIPLVVYGILRYSYLLYAAGQGGRPEIILLKDRHILATVGLFAVLVVALLSVFH